MKKAKAEGTRVLARYQRSAIRGLFPAATTADLDDAIQWSDWTVGRELDEEGWEVQADTIVEVEVGYDTFHVLFFEGLVQGTSAV